MTILHLLKFSVLSCGLALGCIPLKAEEMKMFLPGVNSGVERNCGVEWDKENVVATQLEGTWVANEELSRELSSSFSTEGFSKIK